MVGQVFPVNQEVIHRSAIGIAHHAVKDLAGFEASDFIGEDMVDEGFGLGALDEDFAHVRYVEHTHLLAHGLMLGDDAAVLDGHHEAGEGAHLGAKRHVCVIQTGFLQLIRFRHSFSIALDKWL